MNTELQKTEAAPILPNASAQYKNDALDYHYNQDARTEEELEFEKENKQDFDLIEPPNETELPKGATVEDEKVKSTNKNAWKAVAAIAVIGGLLLGVAGYFVFRTPDKVEKVAQKSNNVTSSSGDFNANSDKTREMLANVYAQTQANSNAQTTYPNYGANSNNANSNVNMVTRPSQAQNVYPPDAVFNPYATANTSANQQVAGSGKNNSNSAVNSKNTASDEKGNRAPLSTASAKSKKTDVVESKEDVPELDSKKAKDAKKSPYRSDDGMNEQRSLYFYAKAENSDTYKKLEVTNKAKLALSVAFGTMLPVRLVGAVHTLNSDGIVRLELTQTVNVTNGTLPSGTMFLGRVSGGLTDRIFISLIGYIDSGKLVKLGGDIDHLDGSLGLKGVSKSVSSRFSAVFSKSIDIFTQLGTAYLNGRSGGNSTIIQPGQVANQLVDSAKNQSQKFVYAPAGTQGYIFVNDLPPAMTRQLDSASARSGSANGNNQSQMDDELKKAIESGSDTELNKLLNK